MRRPDYGRWLEGNPEERRFILFRPQQAFRSLAARHPDDFETMSLGDRGHLVDEFIPEKDCLHFTALAYGYRLQVDRPTDADERQIAVEATVSRHVHAEYPERAANRRGGTMARARLGAIVLSRRNPCRLGVVAVSGVAAAVVRRLLEPSDSVAE